MYLEIELTLGIGFSDPRRRDCVALGVLGSGHCCGAGAPESRQRCVHSWELSHKRQVQLSAVSGSSVAVAGHDVRAPSFSRSSPALFRLRAKASGWPWAARLGSGRAKGRREGGDATTVRFVSCVGRSLPPLPLNFPNTTISCEKIATFATVCNER